MEALGVSSVEYLKALSTLLSTQQDDDGDDEDCKVRHCSLRWSAQILIVHSVHWATRYTYHIPWHRTFLKVRL